MASPPGLFSTITDWPHRLESRSAIKRAPRSAPEPGPSGHMSFTVRCGQPCEAAGVIIASAATTAMTARQDAYDINMRSPLQDSRRSCDLCGSRIKSGLLRPLEAELPRRLRNAGALALDRLRELRGSAGIFD